MHGSMYIIPIAQPRFQYAYLFRLTDDHAVVAEEVVLGNLEVQRSGTLPYTAGDIVVRTVAGAEPATKVTGFTDGHTTQVGTDTWG